MVLSLLHRRTSLLLLLATPAIVLQNVLIGTRLNQNTGDEHGLHVVSNHTLASSSTVSSRPEGNSTVGDVALTIHRKLEFVHIPKTGGTMMTEAAGKQNISWGICHYSLAKMCPAAQKRRLYLQHPRPYDASRWHVPPSYFLQQESPSRHPYNLQDDVDLFCIVRDPYDRLLSEYYFVMQRVKKLPANQTHNSKALNTWAQRMLKLVASSNRTSKQYYVRDAHLVPQWDYVYDSQGNQLIQHVLRYESLQEDFAILQRNEIYKRQLEDIRIPRSDRGRQQQSTDKKLSLANMTSETLNLIESVYKKDFESFGYDKAVSLPQQRTQRET